MRPSVPIDSYSITWKLPSRRLLRCARDLRQREPALDYDTDATYKVSPQRLLWHLQKLGFRGQLNEYLGVFWWNQRKRASGYNGIDVVWNSADVMFSGTWQPGETATLRIGGASGFAPQKIVTTWDTAATIAAHFVYYINSASVSMWAEDLGSGHLVIHPERRTGATRSMRVHKPTVGSPSPEI